MAKFRSTEEDLNSLFASSAWKSEKMPMFPSNFYPEVDGNYCRFSIVSSDEGIPSFSAHEHVGGLIMIEIFTAAGKGPRATTDIADVLDKHLQAKIIGGTQFFRSTLTGIAKDVANPTLARAIYQLPFTHFGVS